MDHLVSIREELSMKVGEEHNVRVIIEQRTKDGNLVGTLLKEGIRDMDWQREGVAQGKKDNYRVVTGLNELREGVILE